MRHLRFLLLALLAACSCDDTRVPGDGPTRDMGAADPDMTSTDRDMATGDMMSMPRDFGVIDPFDPDAGCGAATIPTERVPGSLILLFDRSGSMDNPASGDSGPTKWDLATTAINNALAGVSDDLSMGLMLFPHTSGDECSVGSDAMRVPVAPLRTSRSAIQSALGGASAGGGNTPIASALRAGWDQLDGLEGRGQKGLILVTDGAETCETSAAERDAVLARAMSENASSGYLTYAVGLDESNNFLSTLAFNGATPRNDTCMPECTQKTCYDASECPGGQACNNTSIGGIPVPGQCQCTMDSHCPAGQTCETITLPFIGSMAVCEGPSNCCHYNAEGSSFERDFQDALEDIATRFLDSCVFEVPREGIDRFDPRLVNVGVTFEGEERTVLRQSSDASMDSWNYTTPESDAIIIQGPICDRLLMSAAEVEIVVGCPTIII